MKGQLMSAVNPRTAAAIPPVSTSSNLPVADPGGDGIVVNDHPIARNFLRWGGVAAGVAGLGALAMKMGGRQGVLGGSALGLGIGGAAVGAAMLGFSFIGGLQPKKVPFVESNLADSQTAIQHAVQRGDDTAVYKKEDGSFALVDFSSKDFDNTPISDIDLGNQNIRWEGLVTKDGDLLKQVQGNEYQDIGRAFPRATDISGMAIQDAGTLTGQRIGTTDGHQAATFGNVLGDFGSYAEAARAAHSANGVNTVVKMGDRHVLFGTNMPAGANVGSLEARGTAISPVGNMFLQEDKKMFRAGSPGSDLSFVGRAVDFDTAEPVGTSIGGRGISAVLNQYPSAVDARHAIIGDATLIDRVWTSSTRGVAVIDATNPDGKHAVASYALDGAGGRGAWDRQLGDVKGVLQRESHSWRETQQNNWYDENYATEYYTDFRRDGVFLRDAPGGDLELRTSGDMRVDSGINWYETNRRRNYLRDVRLQEEYDRAHPGDVSTGDDPVGDVSNGDDPQGPSTGDDTQGPSTGDDTQGPSTGDDPAPSQPGNDQPSTGDDDSSGYGNPDEFS